MMSDLSTIRRFLGFGMLFIVINIAQIAVVRRDPAAPLLAAGPGGAGLDRARGSGSCCAPRRPTPGHPARSRTRPATSPRRSRRRRTGSGPSSPSVGSPTSSAPSTPRAAPAARHRDRPGPGPRSSGTLLGAIPSVTLIIVLGFGALAAGQGRVTLGTLVAFTTLMMSLVWPVVGTWASPPRDGAGGDDRRRPDRRDPRRREHHPRRHRELAEVRGELSLQHVPFRFPDADADVLHDVNLA